MENTHGEAFPPKHYGVSDCQLVNCRTLHVWYLYHQLYKHWCMFRVFPQNFPLGLLLFDAYPCTLWEQLVNTSLHLPQCHELQTNNYNQHPNTEKLLVWGVVLTSFDNLFALNLFISEFCPITETYSYISDIFPWFTALHRQDIFWFFIVRLKHKHTFSTSVTFWSGQQGVGAHFCWGRNVAEYSCKHTEHQQSHHIPSITDHWRRSWVVFVLSFLLFFWSCTGF